MSLTGRVVSLSISNGGVPKRPIAEARVQALGLDGDRQNDTKAHGGPERAVCLFSAGLIETLRNEGHPVGAGTMGENVLLGGVDWALVAEGTRFEFASGVLLEVTRFASPCKTIKDSFAEGEFLRVSQVKFPGWSRVYCRVLREGMLKVGEGVTIVPGVQAMVG